MDTSNEILIAVAFIAVVGAVILRICYKIISPRLRIQNEGIETIGIVIDLDFDGNIFLPTIEFQDSIGTNLEFTTKVASKAHHFRIDEPLTIKYLPGTPVQAELSGAKVFRFHIIMWIGIGIFMTAFGLLYYLRILFADISATLG